jgi:hypothetical protein
MKGDYRGRISIEDVPGLIGGMDLNFDDGFTDGLDALSISDCLQLGEFLIGGQAFCLPQTYATTDDPRRGKNALETASGLWP